MKHSVTPPIVVYGAARSGTTYLVQILNRHPEVFVSDDAGESWTLALCELAPISKGGHYVPLMAGRA